MQGFKADHRHGEAQLSLSVRSPWLCRCLLARIPYVLEFRDFGLISASHHVPVDLQVLDVQKREVLEPLGF